MQTNTPISCCTIPKEEIARVKALGFLNCKGTNNFNCRVITRNGKITADESTCITEAARQFGTGEIAMTTRLTLEIQQVPYENIDKIRDFLANGNLETGGTGKKIRPIVSCKGTTCQYGLYDTFAVSDHIHEHFFKKYQDLTLPHKFKIAVGGCPNNCTKPNLNDFGIVGQKIPLFDASKCKNCKVCAMEQACPMGAARVMNGVLSIQKDLCNNCGRCVTKCIFHGNDESILGFKVYIGGRWGKKTAQGKPLNRIFTSEEELYEVLDKALLLFKEQGIDGERFADTIERLGFHNVEQQLIG
ncbi:MAG: (4Fe-4S)-binding protein [Lachnospiraceae bacterium]